MRLLCQSSEALQCIWFHRVNRNRDYEFSSTRQPVGCGHVAAVRSHKPVHDRKPESGSAGTGSSSSMKRFKDMRQIRPRDSTAFVEHRQNDSTIGESSAYDNLRPSLAMGSRVE